MGLSSELKKQGRLPGQGKTKGEPTVSQAAKSTMKKETGPRIDTADAIPNKLIKGATGQSTNEASRVRQRVATAVTSAQAARGARQEAEAEAAAQKATRKLSRDDLRETFAPRVPQKQPRTRAEPAVEIPVAPTPDSQHDVTPPPVADPRPEPAREDAYRPGDGGGNSNFLPTSYDEDTTAPPPVPEEATPPGQEPVSGAGGFGVIGILLLGGLVWLAMRDAPGGGTSGKLNGLLPLPAGEDEAVEEVDVTPEPYSQIVVDKKLRASRAA